MSLSPCGGRRGWRGCVAQRALHRKSRFCTAGTVERAFWPVIRWRSSTTCTASGSLAGEAPGQAKVRHCHPSGFPIAACHPAGPHSPLKLAPASFTKSSTTKGRAAKPGARTSSYTEGCGRDGRWLLTLGAACSQAASPTISAAHSPRSCCSPETPTTHLHGWHSRAQPPPGRWHRWALKGTGQGSRVSVPTCWGRGQQDGQSPGPISGV